MPEYKSVTIRKMYYKILKDLADDEGRSMSNMVEWAISMYANRKNEK